MDRFLQRFRPGGGDGDGQGAAAPSSAANAALDVSMSSAASEPLALESGDPEPDTLAGVSIEDVTRIVRKQGRHQDDEKHLWLKKIVRREGDKVGKTRNYPPLNYDFPKNELGRRFKREYLAKYSWLEFSLADNGCYCIPCVLFATGRGGSRGGQATVSRLVSTPYQDWKKMAEDFKAHEQSGLHRDSMVDSHSFLRQSSRSTNVSLQLDDQAMRMETKAQEHLYKISQLVRFLAKQEIPTRGHRESGDLDDPWGGQNLGNMMALIALQRQLDPKFKANMDSLPNNAKYTSHGVHDELLEIQGELIKAGVVEMIQTGAGGMFALSADESLDEGGVEELIVVIRFVHFNNKGEPKIQERFLSFSPLLSGMTGEVIADQILDTVAESGLDMRYCVGVSFDGASSMRGKEKGARAYIQRKFPDVVYVHCMAHAGNLAANDVSDLRLPVLAISSASRTAKFFGYPKRYNQLKEVSKSLGVPESKKKLLLAIGGTRFIQRYEVATRLIEAFQACILALDSLALNGDLATRDEAEVCLGLMRRFDVVICLEMLAQVGPRLVALASALQSAELDLLKAVQTVTALANEFDKLCVDEEHYDDCYNEASVKAAALNIDIKLPRNMHNRSRQTFYWEELWQPYFKTFATALRRRFSEHQRLAFAQQGILPIHISAADENQLIKAVLAHARIHGRDETQVKGEVSIWRQRWQNEDPESMPKTVLTTIIECDKAFFPSIHCSLRALATIPPSSMEGERGFSNMKRVKAEGRSSMSIKKLNASVHSSANRDIKFDHKEVLRIWKSRQSRRDV